MQNIEQSGPQNKQHCTTHGNAPKGSGSYFRPKLTYSTHIHNISVQAHKLLQIIKALTATGWGKQKDTLMATYKTVLRPALEYASSIWSPLASSTSINKLQVMQNAALRTSPGYTQNTNIQHHHDETLTRALTATRLTIQQKITSHHIHHTPYTNMHHNLTLQGSKSHYLQQRPLHNKHSHRPPHSHYNRHKNKHAPYTCIYCL